MDSASSARNWWPVLFEGICTIFWTLKLRLFWISRISALRCIAVFNLNERFLFYFLNLWYFKVFTNVASLFRDNHLVHHNDMFRVNWVSTLQMGSEADHNCWKSEWNRTRTSGWRTIYVDNKCDVCSSAWSISHSIYPTYRQASKWNLKTRIK